jgi:hypothetical protein
VPGLEGTRKLHKIFIYQWVKETTRRREENEDRRKDFFFAIKEAMEVATLRLY